MAIEKPVRSKHDERTHVRGRPAALAEREERLRA